MFKITLVMFFVIASLGCGSDDDDAIVGPAVPEPPTPLKADKPSDEQQPLPDNTDNNQPDSIAVPPDPEPMKAVPEEVP